MNINLKVARAKMRVTQQELARAVGVNENLISKIETGRVIPDKVLAKGIEKALKTKGLFK